MTAPTIHLNGTSKQSLLEDLEHVYEALNMAYGALKQTAPNGRDYYVQSGDALRAATDEHMARLAKLESIIDEIEQMVAAIDSQ